ncbi:MAG TPA: NADH-quinone oxidoreductase subunit L [Acidimicrobiia bacterium]|nr:NADH-quinone oxidoreductase subunit L [Acidimicrobiia bacterium]
MILATEAEHAAREVLTSGPLLEWAWLIVAVPYVASLLIVLVGKRLPGKGAELAVGALGFVMLYGAVLLYLNITQGVIFESSVTVAEVGAFSLEWGWLVDGLSIMMFFLVGVVGFLVFVFAVGYMRGDVRYTFFWAAFTFFAGSMLLLVSAPNLIQLIVGWEGVGVASYLLIGHYWEDKANSSAGMKAFYTNRVADIGLTIGTIILGTALGTFRIEEINAAAGEGATAITGVAFVGAILLFFGAMGKSAQFPLHVWLPDAMAGPTPVSALMHAATMVTAGVYLVARMFPLFESLAGQHRNWVLIIGSATALLGLLALVQDDIKRVLAYSTVSQLGYMMVALGAGAYTAGLFHLWTHAFFKALLFLCSGSVIHAVHSNNMSDMGGLRKPMRVTFVTWIIGGLALVALPPFAGFFSKDEILAGLDNAGYQSVMWIGVGAAFVTALYMTRATALTFFGVYKGHGHPHESERLMTIPLVILAVLSVVAGWVNVPGVYTGLTEWLGTRQVLFEEFHPEGFEFLPLVAGLVATLLGIFIGWSIYGRDAATQEARDRLRVPGLWPFLQHRLYIDDLYWTGIVQPIKGPLARAVNWTNDYVIDAVVNGVAFATTWLGRVVYGGIDQRGIDFAYNGLSTATDEAGGAVTHLQTGKVQEYAGAFVVGALVLVVLGFVGFFVFG